MAELDQADLHRLLCSLTRELFQTETSAALHCRREAERFGDARPAKAMLAVAEHAEKVLEHLPALMKRNGLPLSRGGMMVGSMFSMLRQRFADHLLDAERSYRGTLLGMRHGVDLMLLFRHVAERIPKPELVTFADDWLSTRETLVREAQEELAWFASHAEYAVKFARPVPFVRRARPS